MSNPNILKVRYVGYGDSLPPIPARDLTREEIDALKPDDIKWMKYSNLYEFITEDDEPKPQKRTKAKE